MKNAMYFAVTVLCIAAAYQLVVPLCESSVVDPSFSGIVALSDTDEMGRVHVLDENGVAWDVHVGSGWASDNDPPIPVSVSQIKFWCRSAFVTYDDHLWMRESDGPYDWVDCGSWPGAGSATQQRSWGGIKSQFR